MTDIKCQDTNYEYKKRIYVDVHDVSKGYVSGLSKQEVKELKTYLSVFTVSSDLATAEYGKRELERLEDLKNHPENIRYLKKDEYMQEEKIARASDQQKEHKPNFFESIFCDNKDYEEATRKLEYLKKESVLKQQNVISYGTICKEDTLDEPEYNFKTDKPYCEMSNTEKYITKYNEYAKHYTNNPYSNNEVDKVPQVAGLNPEEYNFLIKKAEELANSKDTDEKQFGKNELKKLTALLTNPENEYNLISDRLVIKKNLEMPMRTDTHDRKQNDFNARQNEITKYNSNEALRNIVSPNTIRDYEYGKFN